MKPPMPAGLHRWPCLLLLGFLALAMVATAQQDMATVRGTAMDPTGAVVPGAKIELKNVGTNIAREVTTNTSGDFEIPYVIPGTYELTANFEGFKTFIARSIVLVPREVRRLNVQFELGAVGTEVTVSAGAAVIATEGSQIAGGFKTEQFVDSPLSQSFFPQAYMTTLPNVQTNQGGWSLRFAGQEPSQVAENLDGVTNDGTVNLVQNMNDFEDLQVVAVNNSAEHARVAQFSMSGRTGTNAFHGKVYYDLINSALNARNYFDPFKVAYKEHRGGMNVSGPIIKNKTFFYFGYSMVRIPSSSFYNRDVPTQAMRNADFTGRRTINDPLTGQPFPNNAIPANRINDTAKKVQDLYIPAPNQGTPNSTFQNYGFLHPYPTDLYRWDSITPRVDHNFSSKHSIFGRYINRLTPYVLNGPFQEVGTWTRQRKHHSIVVSDTYIFSPTLINTFHWGWIKDYFIDGETTDGFTPVRGEVAVAAIGLQGVNPKGLSGAGFPRMNFTGLQSIFANPGGVNLDQHHFEFADSMVWSKGSHVFKFGAELRTFWDHVNQTKANTFGQFTFDGRFTGEPYADFLLGIPATSQRLDDLPERTRTAYELGLFIQDTFKISRKLTLDYGLRWDYFRHAVYKDELQYNWDPATGNVVVPQGKRSAVSPLYDPRITVVEGQVFPNPAKDNFRPRVGVAYRLTDTFVLRGGYGMFSEALGILHRSQGTGPFEITEVYVNQIVGGQPLFTFPRPFPDDISRAGIPSQSVTGYPLDTDNGVIHQFNLSLEKEFGPLGTRISYYGSRNRGMNYTLSTNKPQPSLIPWTTARRPFPQFTSTAVTLADGKRNYDAFQIQIQKKAGALTFDSHYTLSNSMYDYGNLENPYDHYFWNRDAFNSRHRWVTNVMYDVPVGRGRKYMATAPGVVDHVIGGWRLGWVYYAQSGQYFSPSFSGSDPSNTNTFGGRPDRVADGNFSPDQRDRNRWFDPAAFAVPPAGRFGNSGINILEGPGLNLHHLSAIKEFRMTEQVKFVFQSMITNIFNHPHFDFPNSNISVPASVARVWGLREDDGGREMSGGRQVQMRFRIEW